MRTIAISFTNFGPYHIARLRAFANALASEGDRLIAYETASSQGIYPWKTKRDDEPFQWITLFPDQVLEKIPTASCVNSMKMRLSEHQPEAVFACGYSRPESNAILAWARVNNKPAILMSESQEIDHSRVWWKEAIKRRRVRQFSAALVGGASHRAYLASLGMPPARVVLGYNAVDGAAFAASAAHWRAEADGRESLPNRPYFLAVNRFVPEKNLVALVGAYNLYRRDCGTTPAWDLVLCGDGPGAGDIRCAIAASPYASSIHCPGFLQSDELSRWYAFATAFVHPSLLEPWGLVVNEAAACGLPLLVSNKCGCVETFVPDSVKTTGRRLDGHDIENMAAALAWMAGLSDPERSTLGKNAREISHEWGPERFALGAMESLRVAEHVKIRRGCASLHAS